MKLKYHKIRGVDKTVCTVEQRLAYELAFRARINYSTAWEKLPTATAKHTAVTEIITRQTKILVNECHRVFDLDGTISALHAGIYEYMENPFIATSLEQIGKAFPAYYL